jgi:hypothetical protein
MFAFILSTDKLTKSFERNAIAVSWTWVTGKTFSTPIIGLAWDQTRATGVTRNSANR